VRRRWRSQVSGAVALIHTDVDPAHECAGLGSRLVSRAYAESSATASAVSEVPSSRVMAVSRSLAARYRPAFCGDGSSANARNASLNAAAAAPNDGTRAAMRSR
jgi:hypothetical protein